MSKTKKIVPLEGKDKAKAEFVEAEKAAKEELVAEAEEGKEQEADKENSPASEPEEKPEAEEKGEEKSKPGLQFGKEYERLADKKGFKSPDDLAKSYSELESRTSRVENMAREALKRNQMAPEQGQPEMAPEGEQAALKKLEEVVDRAVQRNMRPIVDKENQSLVDAEIKEIQEVYPDFEGKIVNDAVQWAAQRPGTNLKEAYQVLTYGIARDAALKNMKTEEKQEKKRSAYAEGNEGRSSSREVDFDSMTLEELEEVMPRSGTMIDHKGNLRK